MSRIRPGTAFVGGLLLALIAVIVGWWVSLPKPPAEAVVVGSAPSQAAPVADTQAPAGTGASGGVLAAAPVAPAWLDAVSAAAGIPRRALQAYAETALVMAREDRACRIGWNTLAAIGQEESHHGGHGGAYIADDGHLVGRIIGPALDGGAYAAVPDTDHGRLDGDPTWDHAVGPMQILPSTWARWGADGNGDGVKDPQDIDDAVLSAARYLCASGGDLQSGGGWTAAIRSYNPNDSYVRAVLSDADYYAQAATMAK